MTDAIREKAIEAAALASANEQRRDVGLPPLEVLGTDMTSELVRRYTRVTIAAYEAAMWQPMESAPKNGRTVLLGLHNRLGNWRTFRGCWLSQTDIDDDFEEPELFEPGWYETAEETEECWPVSPTHWRPLFLPPEDKP
jgi:hypothetical protein